MSEIDSLPLPHHQAGGRLAILPRLLASGYWMLLALLIFGASPAIAQVVKSGGNEGDQPPTYKMTVSAAAESRPALKYRFLVPPVDQVEGNAATFYYKSMIFESPDYFRELWETSLADKVEQWLDMPLEKLPEEEIRQQAHILHDSSAWQSLGDASRQNHCDWGDPIRQNGAATLLPQAQKMRDVCVAIALKARLQLANGKYADAIDTLRLGYCLSRNMGHAPSLMQYIVGVAMEDKLDDQVRTLIAAENSPNLYWALSELAAQPVDFRQANSYETRMWEFTNHELPDLDHRTFTVEEARRLAGDVCWYLQFMQWGKHDLTPPEDASLLLWAVQRWPEAQKYLSTNGVSSEELKAMPVLQAVLLYRWKQYLEVSDAYFKSGLLPDEEAEFGRELSREKIEQFLHEGTGQPFSGALPAILRASIDGRLRHKRQTNLLRNVEALRMYAAEHGRWPERLEDIKNIPVPIDPITRGPFQYSLKDGVATLSTPQDVTWNTADGAAGYELTLRPAPKSTSDKPTEK